MAWATDELFAQAKTMYTHPSSAPLETDNCRGVEMRQFAGKSLLVCKQFFPGTPRRGVSIRLVSIRGVSSTASASLARDRLQPTVIRVARS